MKSSSDLSNSDSGPRPKPSPLRALVVDDDAAMRKSLQRVLQLDGYDVTQAGSSTEMLARDDLDQFFAILLDRRLPDGDAGEAVAVLRSRSIDAAILIITGHADLESTLAAIRQGVDDYLIKPVDPDALRTRLNSLAQLHRVREELRTSEARMGFLVEHLPAGAVYVDREKLFMNRAVVEMTGYAQAAIGTVADWFDVLCESDADACRSEYARVKQAGFAAPCQLPIRRRDGVARQLEIAGYRYNHHEVWLVTDITQLRDAQQQLVQSERLAAIGQMVTGLAHESRNALQRARGCLDLLELDLDDQAEQLDLVNRIRRALGDLQRNYEEVRNYAAPIALECKSANICSLAQAAFDDLQYEFGPSANHLQFAPNCEHAPHVPVDRHRITQVFRNVLENAISASPADSTIVFSCQVLSETDAIGPRLQILLSDQGSGLSPETKARIFEPFYTTKQTGTGLGMAICRRIIDAHHGQMWVADSQGQGTTIGIQLPLSQPPPG